MSTPKPKKKSKPKYVNDTKLLLLVKKEFITPSIVISEDNTIFAVADDDNIEKYQKLTDQKYGLYEYVAIGYKFVKLLN